MEGFPAIFISDADVLRLAKPFALSLVGKFAASRPPVDVIRNFILRLKFSGQVCVDPHDKLHVVFRFSDERDYSRFFARRWYRVFGCVMKVVKWSPFHDIAEELPVMPLWISFPGLRHHLFHRSTLMEIASVFGRALCVDFSPASRSNMTRARVLVEIDISETHPGQVWIGSPESGAFQRVVIEDLPPFCVQCRSSGHAAADCLVGVVGCVSVPHTPGPLPTDDVPPIGHGEVCVSGPFPCVQAPSVDVEVDVEDGSAPFFPPAGSDGLCCSGPVPGVQVPSVDIGSDVEVGSAPPVASPPGLVREVALCPPGAGAVGEPWCEGVMVTCPGSAVFDLRRVALSSRGFLSPPVSSEIGPVPCVLDRPGPPCGAMVGDLPGTVGMVGEASPCVGLGDMEAWIEDGVALVGGPVLPCGASAVASPSVPEDLVSVESVPPGLELDGLPCVPGFAGGDNSPPVSPLHRGYPVRGVTTRSMAKGSGSGGRAAGGKRNKKKGKPRYDRDLAIAFQSLFKVPSFTDRSS